MVTMVGQSETLHPADHRHSHAGNRFAVIPTPARLRADARFTGKGVTIAFLDSGFYPHADLTEPDNRILAYHDVAQPNAHLHRNAVTRGWQWHGTQTAVAAAGNGRLSDGLYRGLASDARVVLVKVSDKGRIRDEQVVRGIRWVIANKDRYGIRILSLSLGGDEDLSHTESALDRAAEDAVKAGLVVVVAAGNAGCSENPRPIPPANSPAVITVGGYDDGNRLHDGPPELYCSNYGPTADGFVKPELIAPAMWVAAPILPNTELYKRAAALSHFAAAPDYLLGDLLRLAADPEYLLSDLAHAMWRDAGLPGRILDHRPEAIRALAEARLRDNKIIAAHYQHVDGTSFAAPIVASVVAQMLEANPRLTPAAVKSLLISTADRIPDADVVRQGYGMLNARRAVERAEAETHTLPDTEALSPRVEDGRLIFFYHDDAVEQVALAGDFNGWDPAATPFRQQPDGIWRVEVAPPPPGQYRYKLVINRVRWLEDPSNLLKEPDNYGGLHSLLNLA